MNRSPDPFAMVKVAVFVCALGSVLWLNSIVLGLSVVVQGGIGVGVGVGSVPAGGVGVGVGIGVGVGVACGSLPLLPFPLPFPFPFPLGVGVGVGVGLLSGLGGVTGVPLGVGVGSGRVSPVTVATVTSGMSPSGNVCESIVMSPEPETSTGMGMGLTPLVS